MIRWADGDWRRRQRQRSVVTNNWTSGVLVVVSSLVACGTDKTAASSAAWCVDSFTPGDKVRSSPDACSSARSVSPPLSSMRPTDFCVGCTVRCGATKYPFGGGEYYTDTDLPAGACTNEGEKCDMTATAPLSECNGVVRGCAVNGYRCTCAGGEWMCAMTSQSAGTCGPCEDADLVDDALD